MNRTIAWDKWQDPSEEEVQEDFKSEDWDDDNAEEPDMADIIRKIPELVSTPMGVFRLHDKMNPAKQFDCWIGHTNFDITPEIGESIERVPGVEALVFLTRYRFFLGVGKLFKFRDVRVSIEQMFQNDAEEEVVTHQMDTKTELDVQKIKKEISTNKYWSIFVFPNGHIDFVSTDGENEQEILTFYEKTNLFKEATEACGGMLLGNDFGV